MVLWLQARAVVIGLPILIVSIVLLSFGPGYLTHGQVPVGLLTTAAGAYGCWQVITTPLRVTVSDLMVSFWGLRRAAIPLADIDRAEVVRTQRGWRQRLVRHDGSIAYSYDAGVFNRARLAELLTAAGVRVST